MIMIKKFLCLFLCAGLNAVWAQSADSNDQASEKYEEGLIHMMAGEAGAALLSFEAALKITPDYMEAQLALGDLYLQNGDFGKARRAYERAAQIQPQSPGAQVGLGHVVWQERQDPQAALAYYRAALLFDPQHPEANYFAGKMLAVQNQTAEARAFLEKAITLAPHAYEPHLSLGLCCLSTGQYEAARQHWQAAKTRGAFPLVLLEWCRNLLATVAENAVLFTAGEQETCALWYLQECEEVRREVSIVNLNLLQEVWYIQMLRDRSPCLPIAFDDDYLTAQLRPRLLPAPERMAIAGLDWVLAPTAASQTLRVQDILLLKIIAWNDWQRPLYFAVTVDNADQLGLQEYLSMEGLAWRLCRQKSEPLQPEKTWENVRENYSYAQVKETPLTRNAPALLANYGKIFCLLAETFHKRRAFAQSRAVLAWADSMGVFKDVASNEWAAQLAGNLGEKFSAAKFHAQAEMLRRRK